MIKSAALILATLSTLGLSACSGSIYKPAVYPPYEGAGFTDRLPTEKERILSRKDFSIEVASVKDDRRPRSDAMDATDTIIYEYEPNDLLQGVTYRAPVLINKYLTYGPKKTKHYLADIKMHKMKAQIISGTFLKGGHNGQYRVILEGEIQARRAESSLIVLNQPFAYELVQARRSFDGRHPSAEMDRARTYDLMEDAFRKLAERIAWQIRQQDARYWNIEKDQIQEDTAAAMRAAPQTLTEQLQYQVEPVPTPTYQP
ncbi:MAG: hypothetical protein COY40_00820 [Alphaproteobacteria bacterium CG_4_10_14_0_8_um_filter_53_9]|nr:MAG: hypothetical protein COY40_00820 [Alphaproteobacteria bacterium CG_4_10_14_0_8_um_filter_53_9]